MWKRCSFLSPTTFCSSSSSSSSSCYPSSGVKVKRVSEALTVWRRMDGVSETSTDIGSCIPGFLYSCGYLGETASARRSIKTCLRQYPKGARKGTFDAENKFLFAHVWKSRKASHPPPSSSSPTKEKYKVTSIQVSFLPRSV